MAFEQPGFSFTLVSSADYSAVQFRFVDMNGSGKAVLASAAGRAVGVLQNRPGLNQAATIVNSGIVIVEAGAAIALGADVESDATGRAVTLAAGIKLGTAFEVASGAGIFIGVLLTPAI